MPFEVQLDAPPAGYALELAPEDGQLFVSRLEGIPQQFLSLLPTDANAAPSMVDHLVAIIRKDLTATIYLNECEIHAQIRVARLVEAGEPVLEDDVIDIGRLSFEAVEFPTDAGVACVFSSGWRKGFFFDVEPLLMDGQDRQYEVEELLGS